MKPRGRLAASVPYVVWLQHRISTIYSDRLRARRERGPIHSEARRAQWRAYKATAKGAASRQRYERERGVETRAAYAASSPGIMARDRARLNERMREHGARLDSFRAELGVGADVTLDEMLAEAGQ